MRSPRLDVIGRVLRAGRLLRPLRDPGTRATAVLLLMAAFGFALFGLAWRGAARTVYVPLQVPWVVSAGIAAAAIIGAAMGALSIHLSRRSDATRRAAVDELCRTAYALIDDVTSGRRPLPGSGR